MATGEPATEDTAMRCRTNSEPGKTWNVSSTIAPRAAPASARYRATISRPPFAITRDRSASKRHTGSLDETSLLLRESSKSDTLSSLERSSAFVRRSKNETASIDAGSDGAETTYRMTSFSRTTRPSVTDTDWASESTDVKSSATVHAAAKNRYILTGVTDD